MDNHDGGVDDGVSSTSNEVRGGSQRFTPSHDDPLQGIGGPMTRARTKKMQQALTQFIEEVLVQDSLKISDVEDKPVHVLSII